MFKDVELGGSVWKSKMAEVCSEAKRGNGEYVLRDKSENSRKLGLLYVEVMR